MVDGARVQLNLSEGGSARDPREPSILALGWFSVVVLCYDIGHHGTLHSLQKVNGIPDTAAEERPLLTNSHVVS